MKGLLGIFLLLCLSFNIAAIVSEFDHDLFMSGMDKPSSQKQSDEEVIENFEVYFIHENFLKPAFSNQHKFYGDDLNEEEGEFSMNSDFEKSYVTNLMLKEVALMMSRKKIFNLRDYLNNKYYVGLEKK